jgi:hypothetical protein
MAYAKKHGVTVAGDKQALRQRGRVSVHPEECECRKRRRMRKAVAGRQKPRYGQ